SSPGSSGCVPRRSSSWGGRPIHSAPVEAAALPKSIRTFSLKEFLNPNRGRLGRRAQGGELVGDAVLGLSEPVHRRGPAATPSRLGGRAGRSDDAAAGQDPLQVGGVHLVTERGVVDVLQCRKREFPWCQRESDIGVGEFG